MTSFGEMPMQPEEAARQRSKATWDGDHESSEVKSSSHQGFTSGLRGGLASTIFFLLFSASCCDTPKW